MKIVKQSFEVLPKLDDPIKQIASRARICYKSEDKTQEDERPLLTRIAKHEPIFEMATVSLSIKFSEGLQQYIKTSKYLISSWYRENRGLNHKSYLLVTGSVRAWREFIITYPTHVTIKFKLALQRFSPFLFGNYQGKDYSLPIAKIVEPLQLGLSERVIKLHTHVAVKFTTNRAVSHELVRHRPVAFLQESQRYCRYKDGVIFIDPRPAFPLFKEDHVYGAWRSSVKESQDQYLWLLNKGASPQAARTVLPNSCKTEIIVYCNLREWEHIFNRRLSPAAEPSMREAMAPVYEEFKQMFPGDFDNPKLSVG